MQYRRFLRPTALAWMVLACVLLAPRPASAQGADTGNKNSPRFLFMTSAKAPLVEYRTAPILRRPVTASLQQVTLEQAIAEISRQANVRIGYSAETAGSRRRVSLMARELTLAAALTQVLFETGLDVVFLPGGDAMLVPRKAGGPQVPTGILTGRVVDAESGAPIVAAQVIVVGTGLARHTDDNGRYQIAGVPVGEREVSVRRLGFQMGGLSVRIAENQTVTADFSLRRTATPLREIVTTATGERARIEVGNSVGTIRADSIVATTLIRNMSDLLTARTPGLIVNNTSGMVGAPSSIRIRGASSSTLNNDPIVVLDGIRLLSQTSSTAEQPSLAGSRSMERLATESNAGGTALGSGRRGAPSRLDDIDPSTIESIDVLRGPSAAALYGTEAANGVIVIKTKQGKAGPWRANVSASQGWSHIPGSLPLYWTNYGRTSNGTFGECRVIQWTDGALQLQPPPNLPDGTCVVDSLVAVATQADPDLRVLGTGTARTTNANLSGGTDQLREFLSISVTDNVGMSKLSNAERRRITRMWGMEPPGWMVRPNTEKSINGSSRTNLRVGRTFDASLTVNGVWRDVLAGNAGTGLTNDTLRYLPAEEMRTRQQSLAKRANTAVSANYTPFGWLTFNATVGGDYTLRTDDALARASECTRELNTAGCATGHSNSRGETFVTTANAGVQLSFNPAPWLALRTSAGEQYAKTKMYVLQAGNAANTDLAFGTDLLSPAPVSRASLFGSGQLYTVGERRDASATAGWYLEQTVNLRQRVFLTGALRQDVASAFGESINKDDAPIYPKFSASWLLSDESFFPATRLVSSLRLRTAYGHSGVSASQKDVFHNYGQGQAAINGVTVPTVGLTKVGNLELLPERTRELEGGLDLGLFAGERLTLGFTMYRKLSEDAITPVDLPRSYGVTGKQLQNLGSVENRGVELSLNARLVESRAFGWDAGVNYGSNANKLVRFSGNGYVSAGGENNVGGAQLGQSVLRVGQPLFGFMGNRVMSYADRDGDGYLAYGEVVFYPETTFFGAAYPRHQVTYTSGLTFLNGAVRVSGNVEQQIGIATKAAVQLGNRAALDPDAFLAQQAAMHQALRNNGWITEASTIRLNELSLAYTVPARAARRWLRASSVQMVFAGRNLGFWSSYIGKDPNVDTGSTSSLTSNPADVRVDGGNGVPQPRNWTVRLNVGL